MKYIKYFKEELTLELEPIEFTKKANDSDIRYYFNCLGYDWHVIFSFSEKSNRWTRDYDVDKKHYHSHTSEYINDYMAFMQVSKSPIKIISAVTWITLEFIREYNPECISIFHINMKNEKCLLGQKNKRAKLNYLFLSKYLSGYSFNYYSVKSGPFSKSSDSFGTILVMCKYGKEDKYLEFYENSQVSVKID